MPLLYSYLPVLNKTVYFSLRCARGLVSVSLRLGLSFFFLILCNVLFRGGRRTSSSEALFSSLPGAPPSSPALRLAAAFCMRAVFSVQAAAVQVLRWHAGGVFFLFSDLRRICRWLSDLPFKK